MRKRLAALFCHRRLLRCRDGSQIARTTGFVAAALNLPGRRGIFCRLAVLVVAPVSPEVPNAYRVFFCRKPGRDWTPARYLSANEGRSRSFLVPISYGYMLRRRHAFSSHCIGRQTQTHAPMKYALFPVLLILCTGCGTLATPGTAYINRVAPEADATHITSTSVDNDDQPAELSGYAREALVTRVAAQDSPSADIPEEAFLDRGHRAATPLPIEPEGPMIPPSVLKHREEYMIEYPAGPTWIERSGFLDYMIPIIVDLIDWGGGRLIESFSGSKKKVSGKSRRSSGRSGRKANRTRPERTPNKSSSRGRGRR